MTRARVTFTLALACLIGACAKTEATTAPADTLETTLTYGEQRAAAGISLVLASVEEDSRCPTGVTCVWAGNVRMKVNVRDGKGTVLTLNTNVEPKTADVSGYRVSIVRVLPPAQAGVVIRPSSYSATFRLDRIR
ncbi:MAG: hypothetical protein K2X99_04215 [Gemmatimonadaceae bacterium]|nr:hypothetical protein [Gemmatimonadaceae bacterium]